MLVITRNKKSRDIEINVGNEKILISLLSNQQARIGISASENVYVFRVDDKIEEAKEKKLKNKESKKEENKKELLKKTDKKISKLVRGYFGN